MTRVIGGKEAPAVVKGPRHGSMLASDLNHLDRPRRTMEVVNVDYVGFCQLENSLELTDQLFDAQWFTPRILAKHVKDLLKEQEFSAEKKNILSEGSLLASIGGNTGNTKSCIM